MSLSKEEIETYVSILVEETKKDFGEGYWCAAIGTLTTALIWSLGSDADRDTLEKNILEKIKKS